MGTGTAIPWCDHSWNPWQGCTPVSTGCMECYAHREQRRFGLEPSVVRRSSVATFRSPLAHDQHQAWKWPDGASVFACSWSDWFHTDADPWRSEAWELIRFRPFLRFLLLTKRPERIAAHLPPDWGDGWPNVAIGVSVEDQAAADSRIPRLLRIPCVLRFVSCEPLLGPVSLREVQFEHEFEVDALTGDHGVFRPLQGRSDRKIGWVIAGCESASYMAPGRPAQDDWFRSLRDQCTATGVPFFFKQADRGGLLDHGPTLDGKAWRQQPAWGAL